MPGEAGGSGSGSRLRRASASARQRLPHSRGTSLGRVGVTGSLVVAHLCQSPVLRFKGNQHGRVREGGGS